MKIADWVVAAKDKEQKPVLYWGERRWWEHPELAKSFNSENEARFVMSHLRVPEGAVSIGLLEYESNVDE